MTPQPDHNTSRNSLALATLLAFFIALPLQAIAQIDTKEPAPLNQRTPGAAQAARFLAQSTMGATTQDIKLVQKAGIRNWIQQQLTRPATRTEPYIEALQLYTQENTETSRAQAPYHRVMSAGNYPLCQASCPPLVPFINC